jgi:hypothetical protein
VVPSSSDVHPARDDSTKATASIDRHALTQPQYG